MFDCQNEGNFHLPYDGATFSPMENFEFLSNPGQTLFKHYQI